MEPFSNRITPEFITELAQDEIFVFGSNLQGLHMGGAARMAFEHFGAIWGQGVGLQGSCYAIPTMQGPVSTIKPYVDEFIQFARSHPEKRFLVTRIGCGIAGFTDEQIAPLFQEALPLSNVSLPKEWFEILPGNQYMKLAIDKAREGITQGHGGPFGSVIVKDGKIVGRGHNCVLRDNDATSHGEMQAIRDASRRLGTYDLAGCELYTTGEPCHMCLCACMWANISKIYYGCSIEENGLIGFRDDRFEQIFGGRNNLEGYMTQIDHEACLKLFHEYQALNPKRY